MSLLVESVTDMCKYFLRLSGWTPVFLLLVLFYQHWTVTPIPTLESSGWAVFLSRGVHHRWLDTKVDRGTERTTKMFSFSFFPHNDMQLLLLMPLCSSAVGSVSPCAWGHHTAQSCSSPGWWKNVMTGRCRSRCSTEEGQHTPLRAGPPGSSSRWLWPRWGPGCTARSCPSLRCWSLEVLMTGTPCSTLGSANLRQEWWNTLME